MKRIGFLIGIGLLALAFLATGAELAARGIALADRSADILLLPLSDVWRIVAPASFDALKTSAYWLALEQLFKIPGWILFGVPGMALVVLCNDKSDGIVTREQAQDYEDSLFLYDELAVAAQKEGYTDLPDDMAPGNPADIIPADEHYATNPIEAEYLPTRDYLLDPAKPDTSDNKS